MILLSEQLILLKMKLLKIIKISQWLKGSYNTYNRRITQSQKVFDSLKGQGYETVSNGHE